jgi:hypothetical protein
MRKLVRLLGGVVVIVVLLGGWRYFLESTRPAPLKAWEACKRQILENWAGAHASQATSLAPFTKDHFYSFGGESPSTSFDDHDSRGTAQVDAAKLGVSAHELIQVDQRIAKECGPFPKS